MTGAVVFVVVGWIVVAFVSYIAGAGLGSGKGYDEGYDEGYHQCELDLAQQVHDIITESRQAAREEMCR